MEEITFNVQGSAPEPYIVRFRKDGANLKARCTCPAGTVGQYCKHRIRILEGSDEGIISGSVGDINRVVAWLTGSDVEKALRGVNEATEQFEVAKTQLTNAKKKLARALLD